MANQLDVGSASREALSGDRFGLDVGAEVISTLRETLTGDRLGIITAAESISVLRETLSSDRLGLTFIVDSLSVVREVLIKDPFFNASNASREVLQSRTNEPLTIHSFVPSLRADVVQRRPTTALPGTVQSERVIGGYREMVSQRRSFVQPRSGEWVLTQRMVATSKRATINPALIRSSMWMYGYKQIVVRSRGLVYVPKSGAYLIMYRALALQHRVKTRAPDVHSLITTVTERMLVLISRRTVVSLVDIFIGGVTTLIAQHRPMPTLIGTESVQGVRAVAAQKRITGGVLHSKTDVFTECMLVLQDRVPAVPFSTSSAITVRQAILQHRTLAPQKESDRLVAGQVAIAVQHREVSLPGATSQWRAYSYRQLASQHRATASPINVHGAINVATVIVRFIIGRTTPKPIDVIDPSVGRHVAKLSMIGLQHRVTEPPENIGRVARFAFSAVEQVLLGDVFEDPLIVRSQALAEQVLQPVVLGDVFESSSTVHSSADAQLVLQHAAVSDPFFVDPTVPFSQAVVSQVDQVLAIGDVFPDPALPVSLASVSSVAQQLAIGDVFPDPLLPASDVQARAVIEFAALGDTTLPDPGLPVSDVTAQLVGQLVALGDPFPDPLIALSVAQSGSVTEFIVVRDPTLLRIPLRTNRRRPVITVSIT